MPIYKNSEMTTFYSDNRPERSDECEVRLDDGSIAVSYRGENGWVVYEGPESGNGHFEVAAHSVSGQATLHRFPDGDILEGFWKEGGAIGMWRIQLIQD
jgi:hypothetical protein